MNQKDFQYVVTLSKTLNFTHAADELGITQPSLSQYIKKLERELGIELFIRNGQDIRLSDAGRIYLDSGRSIMDIKRRMQASFLDLMDYKIGSLIIGTSPYRSAGMMPTVVSKFCQLYPGIQVIIEEGTTADILEDAEYGRFDFCVTMLPVNEHIFAYEKVAEEELILAVPASYRTFHSEQLENRKYPAIDIRLLDGQSFVMVTEAQVMQRQLNNLCEEYNIRLKRAATVKSLDAQIAMVRAGVGMALLPTGIERFCSKDEVCFYSFKQNLPHREVAVIWPKKNQLSSIMRSFVECMKGIEW